MIPLSVPNIAGNEWKYVKDCLDTGWISSVGAYVTKFEQMVADFAGAKYGVAAVNGTAALHIALLLSGVKQGDYVILPNLTFVASANSIKYLGAEPLMHQQVRHRFAHVCIIIYHIDCLLTHIHILSSARIR